MTRSDIFEIAALAHEPSGDEYLDAIFSVVDTAIYYRFLYQLMKRFKPALSVELGVERGRCTAHMAAAHPDGIILAIDNDPKTDELNRILERYPNIHFKRDLTTSRPIVDAIPDHSVDLCFFDSDHSCHTVMLEYGVWFQKIKPGGIILFDDITVSPEMMTMWGVLGRISPHLERIGLPELHHSGFGVIII